MFVRLYREGGILQYPSSHLQLENALGLNIIILERAFMVYIISCLTFVHSKFHLDSLYVKTLSVQFRYDQPNQV